jgi:hypothetical protein
MDVARFLDEIRKQKNLSINDISEITETAIRSRFKILVQNMSLSLKLFKYAKQLVLIFL